MVDYRFIINLKPLTSLAAFQAAIRPWGYLLAPDKATPGLRKLASVLRAKRKKLFADNGNFVSIGKLADAHGAAASLLVAKVREQEKRLGHNLREEEVPQRLKRSLTELARTVREQALAVVKDGDNLLGTQLKLNPTHLIGVEDITMAVFLSLNLEPTYLALDRKDYAAFNALVALRAADRLKKLPRQFTSKYYPVASAVSYDTAFDAGVQFAKAGLRKIAMGFGAYMADNNYTDHFYVNGCRIDLPMSIPTRYSRTILVMRGFCEGYSRQAGRLPEAFHFLGLGTPIMIGLVALAAWGIRELTFDATSPIKDAVAGTLYTSIPSFLKISTTKIAFNLASRPGNRWDCPCPFCKCFVKEHPFDYEKGYQWLRKSGESKVSPADLKSKGPLFEPFLLLSEPKTGPLRKAVDEARIGHNHWVLKEVTEQLKKNSADKKCLMSYMNGIVEQYQKSAKNDGFAQAVRLSFKIATIPAGQTIKASDIDAT